MKYENFSQAKELVSEIDETNKIIHELKGTYIYINVVDVNHRILREIGTHETCYDETAHLANNFKYTLIIFYEEKLSRLMNELKEL